MCVYGCENWVEFDLILLHCIFMGKSYLSKFGTNLAELKCRCEMVICT